MKVTRDVIADLWPVYEAGEATADTRALVEEFLAGDAEFARQLRARPVVGVSDAAAPKEVETVALERTRDLVYGRMPGVRGLRLLGIVFLAFAFGRIVSDTSWDRSPNIFIGYLIASAASWIAYGLLLRYYRRRALRTSGQ
jgi:hypothetical protein